VLIVAEVVRLLTRLVLNTQFAEFTNDVDSLKRKIGQLEAQGKFDSFDMSSVFTALYAGDTKRDISRQANTLFARTGLTKTKIF
jgi:hypothetical protein